MTASHRIALSLCIILSSLGLARAADLEISEFMALNTATLVDGYGEYSDWIELHNTTGASMSLDGWYLTDEAADLTKWRIPDLTLASDDYIVIFASGEDDDNPAAELHTNFSLKGNGEYLALVMPDGVTVAQEFTPAYPSQLDDVSYGLIDGVEYFFASPTPGDENVRNNAGQVEFSVESGTFTSSFSVAITAESPNAVIYYTTNGSTPTSSSTLYTGPITISSNTRLRAVATETGKDNGPVIGAYYLKLASDVQSFDSNLPLVIIDTFGSTLSADYDIMAAAVFVNSNDVTRTNLLDEADFVGRTSMHLRGNSSLNFPKNQFKVELQDESLEDIDVDLFDLGADSDWILNAPYSDKTYMRNYITYKWSKQMGDTAVDCQFCEVFLNKDGDSEISYEDYVGIYVLIEKIKIDDERCDTDDMPASPGSANVYNGGFVIEKETSSGRLPGPEGYFNPTIRSGDNWLYTDPSPPEMTDDQKTYVKAKIDRWESVIWSSTQRQYYENYCVGQSFVDFELLQQLCSNNDGWYSSAYVWLNKDDLLEAGPVWDVNIAYGNVNYGSSGDIYDWQDIRTWGWWPKLFADANFSQAWTDRWFELRAGMLSTESINATIDANVAYLAEAELRDHARWPVLGEYVWPNPDGYESRDTWVEEIDFLRNWIHGRANWIDSQFVAMPSFSRDSGIVPEDAVVSMSAAGGTVYYTTDGTDPRSSGGSISSTATGYAPGGFTTDTLIAQDAIWKYDDTGTDLGTAWRALSYDDSGWSAGPAELGYGDGDEDTTVSYGDDADNKYPTTYFRKTFTVDDISDVEDFSISILYDDAAVIYVNGYEIARPNMSTGPISYSTYASVTATEGVWDTYDGLTASYLNEGENIIAVEIHQRTAGSSDISFNLMLNATVAAGEADGIPIEGYTHIKARAYLGGSWSAPIDGYFVPVSMELPVVTEINYHPYDLTTLEVIQGATDEDQMEFIEFYNPSDQTVSLDGFEFVDGVSGQLGAAASLDPGEYGVVVSDATVFAYRYGSAIRILGTFEGSLSNSGERIILNDFLGTAVVDLDYDDSGSWPGRADGDGPSMELNDLEADVKLAASWDSSVYYGGTPGAANGGVSGDIVINEVLTHTDLPYVDYIELHNTTDSLIDISGWWISDSSGTYDKFVVPSATIIPGGAYLVFDEYDFNVTGLDTDPNNDDPNDFGLNSYEGDDVWLVATSGNTPVRFVDHVEFDAAANGESFGRWPNGYGDLYPMSGLTQGYENSGPRVGPVVITEIMYLPTGDDDNLQFIEICNSSAAAIDLTDWQIDKGVDFAFPGGTIIPAGGYIVIAPFDPDDVANASLLDAFELEYDLDVSVTLLGGWDGRLSTNGEKVRLVNPDDPPLEDPTFTPYLTADLLDYMDVSPWPEIATSGNSIQRKSNSVWTSDPTNWMAGTPGPGSGGTLPGDANLDGVVGLDDFIALKQNYGSTGATWQQGDFNLDGTVNLDDFIILKQNYGRSQ